MEKLQTISNNNFLFQKVFTNKYVLHNFVRDIAGIEVEESTLLTYYRIDDTILLGPFPSNEHVQTHVSGGPVVTIELQMVKEVNRLARTGINLGHHYVMDFENHGGAIDINIIHDGTRAIERLEMREERRERTPEELAKFPPFAMINFDLAAEGDMTEKQRQWRKLLVTNKVEDSAPDYMKKAAELASYDNLNKLEKEFCDKVISDYD